MEQENDRLQQVARPRLDWARRTSPWVLWCCGRLTPPEARACIWLASWGKTAGGARFWSAARPRAAFNTLRNTGQRPTTLPQVSRRKGRTRPVSRVLTR